MLNLSLRGRILVFGVGCGLLSSIGICLALIWFRHTNRRRAIHSDLCGLACSTVRPAADGPAARAHRAVTLLAVNSHAETVEERAQAVDLLLDFSQTIQGAAEAGSGSEHARPGASQSPAAVGRCHPRP